MHRFGHDFILVFLRLPWRKPVSGRWRIVLAVLVLLFCAGWESHAQGANAAAVTIQVVDEQQQPLAGIAIRVEVDGREVETATSDAQGHATIHCGKPGACVVSAAGGGYTPIKVAVSDAALQIEMPKAIRNEESVTVQAEGESPMAAVQSGETKLPVAEATASPIKPATLIDALPLVPGVIRTPDGRVKIAGLDEQHSALIINSVDVSDPATGDFGLSVPIDSVDTVKVLQSPYLAQYGNFTAGVVSAETRRGGDKWNYGLNDPLPEVRIRSGHLVGIRSATPRFNLSGPLLRNRLFLLEGTEYLMHKSQVRTLPFPVNETRSTAINSFTQVDTILSARQTLTVTTHFAPNNTQYANLNFFDPQPVTPNANYQENTGTVAHRMEIGGGLLTSTLATTYVSSRVRPQAVGEMTLTPAGNMGSYFGEENAQAIRAQWLETWTPANLHWKGDHIFQLGMVLALAEDNGGLLGRKVRLTDMGGNLLQEISYQGQGSYRVRDVEPSVYAQDHWMINRHVAVDAGLRMETQSLTSTVRFAPRAGISWTPSKDGHGLILRGGAGVFYDQVPLNTYAFRNFPQQVVTTYDGRGKVADGPRVFANVINTEANSRFPFIDQENRSGNFAPFSLAWDVEAEKKFGSAMTLRLRYKQSEARNQLTLRSETDADGSALVLGAAGKGETRQLDLTAGFSPDADHKMYFSYVRQYARGVLTDVTSYLGAFRSPVVRSLSEASAPGEVPNRFLFWGVWKLPARMRIAPHMEYRDGFPFQSVNVLQQFVEQESSPQSRYPRYFALDARISKDVNIGPKHAVRFSITGINLTGHWNYLQVHNNTADPLYGTFFGNYPRRLLLDFDFLF